MSLVFFNWKMYIGSLEARAEITIVYAIADKLVYTV